MPRARHAIALARFAANAPAWFEGRAFELTSRTPRLQELVGDGGTLWVVVSRRVGGETVYSLKFKYVRCRKHTYRRNVGFGKFSVVGDRVRSSVFAWNDATLLLLALRFDPVHPIDDEKDRLRGLGQSLQQARALGPADVRLLDHFAKHLDRWSVFLSYQHDDARRAAALTRALAHRGVAAFQDYMSLAGGEEWWPAITRAIARARLLVVLVGRHTAASSFVRREIQVARRRRVRIVPLLVSGGTIADIEALGLQSIQALQFVGEHRRSTVSRIVASAYER